MIPQLLRLLLLLLLLSGCGLPAIHRPAPGPDGAPARPGARPEARGPDVPADGAGDELAPEVDAAPGSDVIDGEVVVTATRSARATFDTPRSAVTLDDEALHRRRSVRTLPEALEGVPGVGVQKTAHGQGSPFIRGFTGFRTLLLVDGIRLNNSVFREGPNQYWATVDPFAISRLELVGGLGSVLHGSDAIGGTVNALSPDPLGEGLGTRFFGRSLTRVSTAERSVAQRLEGGAQVDEWAAIAVGLTLKDSGDVRAGGSLGTLDRTGYQEWDGDVKLVLAPADDVRLTLALQKVDVDDVWRVHRTIFGKPFHGTTVGSERARVLDQDRTLGYARLTIADLEGPVESVELTLSLHQQRERRFRRRLDVRKGRPRDRVDRQGFQVNTPGLAVQLTSRTPIGRLTYGGDVYQDHVRSHRENYTNHALTSRDLQGPVGDRATYTLLGAYLQSETPIGERLELILGGRLTHARADAREVMDPATGERIRVKDDWTALVGGARLLLQLDEDDHWHLYGGVAQGFRAPNLSDLTRLDTARSGELETPSPGLDPERYVQAELGLKTQYERVTAEVVGFYTWVDDQIVRTPTGRVIDGDLEVRKTNGGNGYVAGVEARLAVKPVDGLTLTAAASWLDGRIDTFPTSAPVRKREVISRLTPPQLQLGARWDGGRWWVEGVAQLVRSQRRLNTRDRGDTQRIPPRGTPGYAVVTLRAGVRITDKISLTGALENATNASYRAHGSGQNEPGMGGTFTLDVRF